MYLHEDRGFFKEVIDAASDYTGVSREQMNCLNNN